MLVLTRKSGESIHLGDNVRITVLSCNGRSVKIGIVAPSHIIVHREEIYQKIVKENRRAAANTKRFNVLREFGAFQNEIQ